MVQIWGGCQFAEWMDLTTYNLSTRLGFFTRNSGNVHCYFLDHCLLTPNN
jgi:hypothetical protein